MFQALLSPSIVPLRCAAAVGGTPRGVALGSILGVLLLGPASFGAVQGEGVEQVEESSVRLVVMLSVDQLIPEQLERLAPALNGGLGRLLQKGASYHDARLPYARTETGAGHVTFSTGCLPRTHGVVGNSFYNRELARDMYCVEDVDAYSIQSAGKVEGTGRRSPVNLMRPTLPELLQRENAATQVVSISGKDRAAIGMAGRADGLVLWWDKGGSGFQSSNFYCDALPGFVGAWNDGWQASFRGWTWNPIAERTDADFELLGTAADDRPGERPLGKLGTTFPYTFADDASPKTMGGLAFQTPLADRFVIEMATAAIQEMSLGADDDVDVLALSFSACDVIGHANGPYSREVTDVLLRLDEGLGRLFELLDKNVGSGRWTAALTADHGVLALPEYLQARGVESRRITREEASQFGTDLAAGLTEKLGARVRFRSVPGGFRLDSKDMAEAEVDPAAARLAAAELVRELAKSHRWVASAYSLEELAALDATATGTEALLRNTFHPLRAPDVTVVNGSHLLKGMSRGTSHGSPYDYDRHVPMMFYGPKFPAGTSYRATGSQDITPTLLGSLGIAFDAQSFDGVDLYGEE